jgi:predicted Zn-dependent protease
MWAELVARAESALYLDPHGTEVHRLLAEGYIRTNRAREALAEADAALATEPDQPGPALLTKARALAALGRSAEAQRTAAEAARTDPSLAEEARGIGR